jgi:hypothetical protein
MGPLRGDPIFLSAIAITIIIKNEAVLINHLLVNEAHVRTYK